MTTKEFEQEHFNLTPEELDKAWENTEYRIRKLTPRECYRLMDVNEENIDKMANVVSPTQQYKQAGNSIVVAVLCAIFSQLDIQGIKTWNERTLEERKSLTAKGVNHETNRER